MKKSSLLALSLVSMVSLVGCGKPVAADYKKSAESYVKDFFGEEYVKDIEYGEHYYYGVPSAIIGFYYELDEGATYFDLLEDAYDESKPLLEKLGFSVDAEPEDFPDYEQAEFSFYYVDNEDPEKAKVCTYFFCFTGLDDGDPFLQVEFLDMSSLLN